MKDVLRHFLLSGDLIENLAEAILYELIAEICYSGALSTVSIPIDMDLWSIHLYKAWQRTASKHGSLRRARNTGDRSESRRATESIGYENGSDSLTRRSKKLS